MLTAYAGHRHDEGAPQANRRKQVTPRESTRHFSFPLDRSLVTHMGFLDRSTHSGMNLSRVNSPVNGLFSV